jgi:hypothetical protein
MTDWLLAFGKLFILIIITLGGMLLVRKNLTLSTLESHNEVAGYVYQVVGVIYAVLMAFIVYAVFQQNQTAEARVEKEAALLGDLYRVSSSLQEPVRGEILQDLRRYAQVMIDKEFPAMAEGKFHEEAKRQHDKIWDLLYHYKPKDEVDKIWFDKTLTTALAFASAKRDRMASANQTLPPFLWLVLYAGGFITVAYSFFFGTRNVWAQGLIVVFLTGSVGLVLLLIAAYDHPFSGIIQVSPEPFAIFLSYFK